MSEDWRTQLEAARRPVTPAQRAWDGPWGAWYRRALAKGRTHAEAIEIADREQTERQGPRPEPKETQT